MSADMAKTARDLLREARDPAAPGWRDRYRLGVALNRDMEHVASLAEIADELGITRQNAYTETVLALGSLAFAIAARHPEMTGLGRTKAALSCDRRA